MAHFPRHEVPKWEMFRDQSLLCKDRKDALEQMHIRINKAREPISGLWWAEQRYVDQVVPSECVNPDYFDTFQYRYQIFARPPPIMCEPHSLAQVSDKPFPVRYNVKRIAQDKPFGLVTPKCLHHYSRHPLKYGSLIPEDGSAQRKDCSKNNNTFSITKSSPESQIDYMANSKRPLREVPAGLNHPATPGTKRSGNAGIKSPANESPTNCDLNADANTSGNAVIRSPGSEIIRNGIRNNWIMEANHDGIRTTNQSKVQYTRCESPMNQMCPKLDAAFEPAQHKVLDLSRGRDTRQEGCSPRNGRASRSSTASVSSCSISNSTANANSNKRSVCTRNSQNGFLTESDPGHTSRIGFPQSVKRNVGRLSVDASVVSLLNPDTTYNKASRSGPTNQTTSSAILSTSVNRRASASRLSVDSVASLLSDHNINKNNNENDTDIREPGEFSYAIDRLFIDEESMLAPEFHTCITQCSNMEQACRPYITDSCTPATFCLCKNNNAGGSSQVSVDSKSCCPIYHDHALASVWKYPDCDARPSSSASVSKRLGCGTLVFSRMAEMAPVKSSSALNKPREFSLSAPPPRPGNPALSAENTYPTPSQPLPEIIETPKHCYRSVYKCSLVGGTPDVKLKHTTPEIGYNTYKIIGSKQYREPQQEDVLANMKRPPHLAEYHEFIRRCPNFAVGRYDRLDPANEMLLPSNRNTTNMAGSLSPFTYATNPNRGKYPPLFHQPVNTHIIQWELPSWITKTGDRS